MSAVGPGDWVECINAEPLFSGTPPPPLMYGALYCVTWVGVSQRGALRGESVVRLAGVPLPPRKRGFWLQRFRPIRDGQERIERKATTKVPTHPELVET